MTSRSRSRDRSVNRDSRGWSRSRSRSDRGRSPIPRSVGSRSPSPDRRHDYRRDSRDSRDSRSRSPSTRGNNKRYRSRSYSRSRSYDSRSRSRSRSGSIPPGAPETGSTKIVVERLTKNVNENHLREIFGQYGEIEELELPLNRQAGTNRGTAYITYSRRKDAEVAFASMHEGTIDGAIVHVSIFLPPSIFKEPPPSLSEYDHPRPNYESRNPPPNFRGPFSGGAAFGGRAPPSGRARRSPGPSGGSNRYDHRSDTYRPRSTSRSSRSRSPKPLGPGGRRYRSRSSSYSSRSRSASRSTTARGGRGGRSRRSYDDRDRRRSPSRGSYDSYDRRSRSRSRSRDWDRR